MPADRQVIIDLGHFSTFPSQVLQVGAPGRFLPALGFGSIGLALAAGIGAATARTIPTVVVVGDGGALMSLNELETLRRSGADVTVVVLNDEAYGAEIHHLRHHGLPEESATIPPFDFAAVAGAAGLRAHTIDRLPDAADLESVIRRPGPTLLDVHVTRAAVADRFRSD